MENNDGSVKIEADKASGGNDGIDITNNTGTINLEVKDSESAGEIEINGTTGNGIEITSNSGEINLNQALEEGETPGDVKGGDNGILINGNSGEDASVNLTVKDVTGDTEDGIYVQNNAASVKIEASTASGGDDGIVGIPA